MIYIAIFFFIMYTISSYALYRTQRDLEAVIEISQLVMNRQTAIIKELEAKLNEKENLPG